MKKFIACLLLGALLGMIPPLLPAQQNQNAQKFEQKIEALRKRILELEKQLQIVENIEKMDLQAKLAEANTKLINAEVDKYERGLRDSNDKWLRNWGIFFLAILSAIGVVFWFWLRSKSDGLIANEVEKSLNGFKEAVDAQDVIKNQLGVLEKQYTASMLEDVIGSFLEDEHYHPEQIKPLREETLLQILDDETCRPELRYKAAEVLGTRKSSRLVSPLLSFLNSLVDSDSGLDLVTKNRGDGVKFLAYIHTPQAYQGLKEFLNRLLTDNPKRKNWFLMETVLSLAEVSAKLDVGDSVPILRKAILHLNPHGEYEALGELARYFDIFNDPAGIKDILTNHVAGEMPNWELERRSIEDKCLELLQKHDPEFVKEWRARKTTDNREA